MDAMLNDKFEQILNFEKEGERFENENQVVPYLRIVTSCRYCLSVSLHRQWGNKDSPKEEGRFFQIVPDQVDDGFFDWYCDNHPFHQFFRTAEMALLHFVFYWHVWKSEKQPAAGGQQF